MFSLNLFSLYLQMLLHISSLQTLLKILAILLITPLYALEACNGLSTGSSFPQAEQPQLYHTHFIEERLQPFNYLCGPLLYPF